ncbi:MAG TPA: hypothetical protein H9761_05950 [Candidatus Eisenbergiella merdavium]|uniref:Uncharacterized protein n=1 Tax=Candidatus Eisenbergiella merdavium TaxID=2838551 RepID=A0A9D2NF73_9FIRM|nr:hypothetical protein [Candidatus Eisenbergiella merdavium]
MAETFISNQIAVYKNSKVLLEFQDRLKAASIPNYGHIHADGEPDTNGRKRHSLIRILMKDYSKGTGDQAITVTANISPEDARFILSRLTACIPEFGFQQEKIFGQTDEHGYCTVTKVRFLRTTKDKNGSPRKIPWYVEVENGKGIPQTNANGGTYMKSGSFISQGRVNANLTDQDLFRLLSRVSAYISGWEAAIAPPLITKAKKALEERRNTA